MPEIIVKKLNLSIDKGYIYFIDEDGKPSRIKQISPPGKKAKIEKISSFKVKRSPGYVYFINGSGNIAKVSLMKKVKLEHKNVVDIKKKKNISKNKKKISKRK